MAEGKTYDARRALATALEDIASLRKSDDATILATRWVWNLRDDPDGVHSTQNMTDEELCQAFVEDLLIAHDLRRKGKYIDFTFDFMQRFLLPESSARLREVVSDHALVQSFLRTTADGCLRIAENELLEAMDFSGVWLEGYTPLDDEVIYAAGHLPS